MKKIIQLVISHCGECPYKKWEANTHEGNYDGTLWCEKTDRMIAVDEKKPKIPRWCPLETAVAKIRKEGRHG